MKFDLHLHSTASDGNWTPSQLVAHAINIGMDAIALSDHDTTDGIDEAIAAADTRVEIIPAVEINCVWRNGQERDVHILGYFIDWKSMALLDLFERQLSARRWQAQEMVRRLQDSGIMVDMEQIREIAAERPIGSIHICQAIVLAGGAADVSEAYDKFCRPDSAFRVVRPSVSPEDAIAAIHTAGGVTSIAHPSYSEDLTPVIIELAEVGLDAIEVYHRSHSEQNIAHHLELAKRLGLAVTGGSDCHGPFEDHESLMGSIAMPPHLVQELKTRHRVLRQTQQNAHDRRPC